MGSAQACSLSPFYSETGEEGILRKLKDLAEIVGGVVLGDSDMMIVGVGSVQDGASPGTITFAESRELHIAAEKTEAAAIIVPKTITESTKTLLQVNNPRLAYAKIAEEFMPRPLKTGLTHPTSVIHPDAQLAEGVSIHPHVVIDAGAQIGAQTIIGPGTYIGKDVKIGSDCELHANVVIEYQTEIGDRVIIQAGAVLGSDGYGFVTTEDGHLKIPQLGYLIVEDDVEIGANVTIDRGAIGPTKVGRGSKLDNLVHLAHNVTTGPECLFIAQSGVAGSTKMGKRVVLAGQSGVYGHVRIGDNVTLAARGVITNDTKDGAFLSGAPAQDHRQDYRIKAAMRKLPDLLKQVRDLTKKISNLEEKENIKRND